MKTKWIVVIGVLTSVLFVSCSQRLVGTWNVQKYETTTPGQQGIVLQNIGTITFKGNNTGEKQLNYSIMGIVREDKVPFKWSLNERFLTIDSEGSDLSKTWIIMEDSKKYQKLKSTDGANEVQILELNK
jgi:hypothetical protein